jgi:DNA anti-recombination protein RmuC
LVEIDRTNKKASDQSEVLLKRIDTEHKTVESISEKLSASITDNHSHLDSKLTDACEALDKKFGEKIVQHEERLGSEHRHFTDVCTRIEQTFNSNLDELDAAFIEACNKLDSSGAENRKAIDQHHAHFTQCVDQLGQDMANDAAATAKTVDKNMTQTVEALTKLEATLSRDIALLDSSMLEKSAQQDERADELSAMVTQIEKSAKEDLSAQTRESSAQLAEVKADLGGDLRALEQKVDVEVRDQISTLDADVGRRLSDLKNLVEDKVQKSIDTMSTSLDAMNTRVKKEMEPKLAETELAVRSVSSKLETLETRVMLEQDELKTGMTKSLETMSTELDELGEKVDGMTADLDINALLMGAASAKP